MKQRIKLAFKILFCKSYLFTDLYVVNIRNLSHNECLIISKALLDTVERVNNEESILNEAKQILCQKQ